MAYWLFKTEPNSYSFASSVGRARSDDGLGRCAELPGAELLAGSDPGGRWGAFYHSNADPPCIAGIAEVVRAGHSQTRLRFDRNATITTPRATRPKPTWFQVSIRGVRCIQSAVGASLFEDGGRTGRYGVAAEGKPALGAARNRTGMEDDPLTCEVENQAIIALRGPDSRFSTLEFGLWTLESRKAHDVSDRTFRDLCRRPDCAQELLCRRIRPTRDL